jgi:hypothetical protein
VKRYTVMTCAFVTFRLLLDVRVLRALGPGRAATVGWLCWTIPLSWLRDHAPVAAKSLDSACVTANDSTETLSHKYGTMIRMKTTVEIPDALFRRAKSAAAERGIPLRALISEALLDKLSPSRTEQAPWMNSFGKLKAVRKESARILRVIEEEFETLDTSPSLCSPS